MRSTPEQDLALARRASAGQQSPTEQLLDRLGCIPAMLRIRERKVGIRLAAEEREETVQETLAAVWAKLSVFDGRTPLEAWVYGFVVREHYKALGRRKRQMLPEDPDCRPAPASRATVQLGTSVLQATIDSLGPPSSEIVRMRHFDELEFGEIAETLAIPTNTVKTRYYRAIQRLRVLLRPIWREVNG